MNDGGLPASKQRQGERPASERAGLRRGSSHTRTTETAERPAQPIRVLLADSQTVVRQGLRRILATDEAIEIVGETGDGRSAVEMAERLQPDVVVMDVALPELNGIEATHWIVERTKRTKVLILTTVADDMAVRRGLKAGASGYLLKAAEDLDLLKAVKAIAHGASSFSPLVSQMLLRGYLGNKGGRSVEDDVALLTEREREVLQHIAEGKVNKEIAAALSISPNTVETHRKRIMEKLDLHNTAALVRFAMRKRIVT
jgi:DNA-binding NarL/FixJ family response regulator